MKSAHLTGRFRPGQDAGSALEVRGQRVQLRRRRRSRCTGLPSQRHDRYALGRQSTRILDAQHRRQCRRHQDRRVSRHPAARPRVRLRREGDIKSLDLGRIHKDEVTNSKEVWSSPSREGKSSGRIVGKDGIVKLQRGKRSQKNSSISRSEENLEIHSADSIS